MKGLSGFLSSVLGRGEAPGAPPQPVPSRPPAPYEAFESGVYASRLPVDLAFPEREGIPHDSAGALLESNRGLVLQARDTFQAKSELPQADRLIHDLIYRFACQVGTLPASRTYHHTSRGGLFQHSLAVAVGALHMAQGKNMVYGSSPRDRDAHMLGWQLAVFIAALLHDIGKIHTIGQVQAMGVEQDAEDGAFRSMSAPTYDTIWYPTVESFERWAEINRVTSYFIDFDQAETRPHVGFTERHLTRVVPSAILAFIHKGNPHVLSMFETFLRNPDTGANTPLSTLVHDADHANVAQALNPRRKPGAMPVTGLVWRRLTEFAADATWNLPTSPFLRAHVQVEGTEPKRFVQMPFFVATQENISAFIEYIVSRPLFNIGIGRRNAELVVFGALESAAHINRTIGDVLPSQIPVEGMPEYIPASTAHVLFMPRRTQATVAEGPISTEPVLLDLPVIPLGGAIATHQTQHMPTLGFGTPPSYPVTDSIPIMMIGGEIKPEDPNRENDKSYVEDLEELVGKRDRYREIARSHNLSAQEAEGFGDLAESGQAAFDFAPDDVPSRGESDRGAGARKLGARFGKPDGASTAAPEAPETSGPVESEDPTEQPVESEDPAEETVAPGPAQDRTSTGKSTDTTSTAKSAQGKPVAKKSDDKADRSSAAKSKAGRKPKAKVSADRTAAPAGAREAAQVDAPAPKTSPAASKGPTDGEAGPGFATDAPAGAPFWQKVYMARGETPAATVWAAAWAFFRDGAGPTRSYRPSDGVYAFATQSMSQKMRETFLGAVRGHGCDPSRVSDAWSAKGLSKGHPVFDTWFSPRRDNQMVVCGEVADLLDRALETETEEVQP